MDSNIFSKSQTASYLTAKPYSCNISTASGSETMMTFHRQYNSRLMPFHDMIVSDTFVTAQSQTSLAMNDNILLVPSNADAYVQFNSIQCLYSRILHPYKVVIHV